MPRDLLNKYNLFNFKFVFTLLTTTNSLILSQKETTNAANADLEEPSAAGPDLAGGHLLVVLDHLHPPQTAGHQAHLALLARHRHRQGVRHKDTAQLFVLVLPRRSHLTVLQLRSLRGPTHNLSHTHTTCHT